MTTDAGQNNARNTDTVDTDVGAEKLPVIIRHLYLEFNNDVQQVLEVFRQSFFDHWSEERLRQLVATRGISVHLAGRGLAVSAALIYQRRKTSYRILSLGVLQDVRRQLYASCLLDHLQFRVEQSKKVTGITAYIATSNEPARKLFEKFDFHQVKSLPNYYGPNVGAFVYHWTRADTPT